MLKVEERDWPIVVLLAALVLLFGLILLGVWASDTPGQQVNCLPNPGTPNTLSCQAPQESFWQRTWNDPVSWFTFILTLFSGALVATSVAQSAALRRANENARDAAQALPLIERAYVYAKVKAQDPIHTCDGMAPIRIRAEFWNRGKTPAAMRQIRVYGMIQASVPTGLIDHPGADRAFPEGLIIAADLGWSEDLDLPVPVFELERIADQGRTIFCCGLISYRDVLDRDRETGFCWQYRPHFERKTNKWDGGEFIISDSPLNYTR